MERMGAKLRHSIIPVVGGRDTPFFTSLLAYIKFHFLGAFSVFSSQISV
jgi:hypothetical protein